jgi:propanediol dehydratase large subunit
MLAAMNDREAINEEETEARRKLVSFAKATLEGTVSYLEGSSKVLEVKNQIGGVRDRDDDFDVFVVIQSDIDSDIDL